MSRNFRMMCAATVLLLAAVVAFLGPPFTKPVRAEFSKRVSIPGGTPAERLSVSLGNAGYVGQSSLDELTICVPSTNANSMYLGSSASVNASTGFELARGACITYRAAGRAIDTSSYYVFVATTESAAITLRSR